jgi:hypothetical protein
MVACQNQSIVQLLATATPTSTLTATPSPTPTPLSVTDIIEGVSPSVAFIKTADRAGSGLLIEGGFVLTNAHVVWPFEDVRVVFPDGSEFTDVPVANWDLIADLAILGPLETDITPAILTDGESQKIGSDTYLIGYPGEVDNFPEPTIVRGLLSRVREWELAGITYFQTDSSTAGGQSGGVLVTDRGEIIGISGFAFTEAGYGLVASAADIQSRINALLDGEDIAGLGNRQLPTKDDGSLEYDITLNNIWDTRTFVIFEESGEDVDIQVDGVEDVSFTVFDTVGNPLALVDNSLAGIEQETISVKNNAPLFLTITHLLERGGDFQVSSSHKLVEYEDADDGTILSMNETISSNIDFPYDLDWYSLDLEADELINIRAESASIDPIIVIDYHGAKDEQIIVDENSGGGLFGADAEITYKVPHAGTYRIIVSDQSSQNNLGGYILSVTKPDDNAPTPIAPKPTATAVVGPYGPLAVYVSAQHNFSIQYPEHFTERPPRNQIENLICELATKCYLAGTGELFSISEVDLETLGFGKMSLDEYLKFDRGGLGVTQKIERFEIQGIPVARITQTLNPNFDFSVQKIIYVQDERVAITATYFGTTAQMTNLEPMIDYSFQTIQMTDDPSVEATTIAQLGATSTAVAQITATAIAPIQEIINKTDTWETVFLDTFDTNENGWVIRPEIDSELADGRIEIKDGSYVWDVTAKQGFWWYGASDRGVASDFALSTDVRLKRGQTGEYGLSFREHKSDYYTFTITPNQYFRVSLYYDDRWISLIDWEKSYAIKPYDFNNITVIAEEQDFYFFINNQFVGQITDDHIKYGWYACFIDMHNEGDKAVIEFDNFGLRIP